MSLQEELYAFIDSVPGTVGVAFVSEGDTVTVNNGVHYPMMSVFKMHEALAVANTLERSGISLDTILSINRVDLDLDTWSPMLKEHAGDEFSVTVRELLRYTLAPNALLFL